MPQTFVIDQAATFAAVAFLSSTPRIEFGTRDKQETDRDGTPKWSVELVAAFRQFDKITNEVVKVTITSPKDPGESLGMYTPVQMIGFQIGVTPPEERTDKDGRKKITGGTVWYRAQEIRPLTAAPAPSRRSE
jgi:hypothetical protein